MEINRLNETEGQLEEEPALLDCLGKYFAENREENEKPMKAWLTGNKTNWPLDPYSLNRGSRRERGRDMEEADQFDRRQHVIKTSCALEHSEESYRATCEACLMAGVDQLRNETGYAVEFLVKFEECLKQMTDKACRKVFQGTW